MTARPPEPLTPSRYQPQTQGGRDRSLPAPALVAVIAVMLGVAVGLLIALAKSPAPAPAPAAAAAVPARLSYESARPWPTWPSSMTVSVDGGELVVVLATAVPTELPTATPGVVPTSTPLLPACGSAVPGQVCEWADPTATPSPIPLCETPVPGDRCVWPTATPQPTVASIPSPPQLVRQPQS